MSNYTKSTNFATKDNLTPGDPLKVVRGTEIDTEFNNIATAVATKTDNASAAITGGTIDGATVGATTPATGAFTTLAASGTTTLAGALVGAATQSAFNTVSTTLNLGGAATALNLGAATGTATVNNTTLAAKAITASTTLAVTGTSTLTGAVTATAGVSGPITSSSVSITGGSITGITDLAVADGGTGASTAAGGLNNLLPSQTGNASKYLQTDGTNASWDAVSLSTADITGTLGAANGGTGVSNNAAMTVTGSGNFAYTRTLTGTTNVTFPTTGTLATLAGTETLTNKTINLTSNTLVATSAQILAAVTDETGTGALVFATSPTLVTPTLGVATGTSFQGIIGNVTPAAGAFTTVTASTAIGTASGGTGLGGATPFTSGGVVYASSGSALATGSALTFNGTLQTIASASSGAVLELLRLNNSGTGSGTQSQITFLAASTNYAQITGGFDGAPSLISNVSTGGYQAWQVNNSEVFRATGSFLYTASGINVGIGTSNPSDKLTVAGSARIGTGTTTPSLLTLYPSASAKGWQISANNYVGSALEFTCATANGGTTFSTPSMLLDSSGNLVVGATSANAKFEVSVAGTASYSPSSAPTATVLLSTDGAANSRYTSIGIGSRGASGQSQTNYITNVPEATDGNAALAFSVYGGYAAVERARITSTGNFSVGKSTAEETQASGSGYGLNVDGGNGPYFSIVQTSAATGNACIYLNRKNSSGSMQVFQYDNTIVGSISHTSSATAYNTTSDQRLKENIVDAPDFGSVIDSLKVRSFDWKSDSTHQRAGFIAQELVIVAPEAVHQPADTEEMMAVDYSKLVPMLVKEIQSLRQRLSAANL